MSSASRPSEAAVKPTRSANSTLTSRRSACGEGSAPDAGTGVVSTAPHSPQNFAPAVFGVPQAAHGRANDAPHSPQNLRPASFSSPQASHLTSIVTFYLASRGARSSL